MLFVVPGPGAGSHGERPPPPLVGWVIILVALDAMALMPVFAALKLSTVRAVRDRRHRTLCLVTSALSCLLIPYGAVHGVSGLMVLERATVRGLFAPPAARAARRRDPGASRSGEPS
jgi:TctA family transporter